MPSGASPRATSISAARTLSVSARRADRPFHCPSDSSAARPYLPAGTDAGAWVREEAVVKAGLVAGAAQVLGLSPPLPGYASALALPMAYAGGRVAQHDAAALLTP